MRTHVVVLLEPMIDDGLCLFRCCKLFGVEDLVPQSTVEPLVVSIFPRGPRIDSNWSNTDADQPLLHRLGYELGTVLGADILWCAMAEEQRI